MENVSPATWKMLNGRRSRASFSGGDADVGELAGLDERCDLRRAQDQTEIRIGVALVGNNLDGLLKHRHCQHGRQWQTCQLWV